MKEHVYHRLRLYHINAKIVGYDFIKWTSENEISANNIDKKHLVTGTPKFIFITYLYIDTLYYMLVKMEMTKTELVYVFQIPVMFLLMVRSHVKIKLNRVLFYNMINQLEKVEKETRKFHNFDRSRRSVDYLILYICTCNLLMVPFFFIALIVHYMVPTAKMYTLQILVASFAGVLLVFSVAVTAILVDRIQIWVELLQNYAESNNVTEDMCDYCILPVKKLNLLCEKHMLRYMPYLLKKCIQAFCFIHFFLGKRHMFILFS